MTFGRVDLLRDLRIESCGNVSSMSELPTVGREPGLGASFIVLSVQHYYATQQNLRHHCCGGEGED